MPHRLLQSTPDGELPTWLQACLGLISLTLATLLFLAVRSFIPVSSGTGHLALTALFIAAVPGYLVFLSVLLKIVQGSRVQPGARP